MLAVIIAATVNVMAQNQTVTGVVLDAATDEPLMGASVLPVGSSNGVATDMDGKFTLSIPASIKEVTVSYIGYTSVTLPVQANMTIKLQPSSTILDQVVVTGYGSAKKLGSIVGSVSVVDNTVLENTPAATFVDALQGQVPGLAIYSNSGDPSSTNNSVYMRGRNSLSASNAPLYILDGAPITSELFTTLNPNDIENITVLKDAASTAIYGSRAANGVIVVTSKKGKFGENAKVTVRANFGWSGMATDNLDMMNSQQYIQYREMLNKYYGVADLSEDAKNAWNLYGIDTDWRKEMFKSSAPTYSIEAAVQGGSESFNYFLSLNHYDQEGIIENSGMNRETLRSNFEAKVNNWFRVGANINLGYTKYRTNPYSDDVYAGDYDEGYPVQNPMMFARMALPYDSPNYYTIDENGRPVFGDESYKLHYTGWSTPAYTSWVRHGYQRKLTINASIFEQITPVKGLTIRAQQSVDAFDWTNTARAYPFESYLSPMGDRIGSQAVGLINPGSVSRQFERYYAFTYTNTADYRITIADVHNIYALIGQEAIISKDDYFGASGSGQTDARLMLLQNSVENTRSVVESLSEYVFNSYFFNASYDYDNRYFIDGSLRRDGSSRFAPKHRWGTFGSVGLMWNLKGEKFLQSCTWLDDLKLRYNWGSTGNAGIGNYAWRGTVVAGSNYNGEGATTIGNPGNPDLTWETVIKNDVGLTVGVFDRIRLQVDYYANKTKNMLMSVPYSYTTGVASAVGNICEMTNKGVEVDLNGDIFKNKDWYVGASVNFAYNQNRITKLFDGSDAYTIPNTGVRYEVGHDSGEFYMVRYKGVDPRDGKQIWYDKDGNETKVFPTDAYVMTGKSSFAPWTGGFGVNARWKGLSVSANFNWAAKKYMANNAIYFYRNGNSTFVNYNKTVDMLTTWTTPGQVTDIPAYGEELQMDGDNFLEDASFLRLKNLTVQYSLPTNWLKAAKINALTVHFTGRNLLTWTDFTGDDPEPQSNLIQFQYPNTRQYEFGIELSF